MEILDRVYYIRALLGAIAGMIIGLVIVPGTGQGTVIGTIILMGLIFYFVLYIVSRRMSRTIAKEQRRKLTTNGIVPFIFLLLMFMIIIYTWLHQNLAE